MIQDPDYAAFLTKATIACRQRGYALTVHGSMIRDLDVVAIPRAQNVADPATLIEGVVFHTNWKMQDKKPVMRHHGRMVYSLLAMKPEDPRWIDFSIMPNTENTEVSNDDRREELG